MIYKKYDNNSFNLYTINSNKFKTCKLLIMFYKNINKEDITKEIVLQELLSYSTNKYKTKKELLIKLKDLYDLDFNSYTSRIGNIRTINFSYTFLDPLYADKNYLKEVLKIPFEILFKPNINHQEFDNNILNIIKDKIKYNIDNKKEDILSYSIDEALKKTDKDNIVSYDYLGNIKALNKINSSNIYDFYKYMLDNYYCDIYLVGNLDMDKINIIISELFDNYTIKTDKLTIDTKFKNQNYITKTNIKDNYSQSILINTYSLNNLSDKDKYYNLYVFNYLFGGSSLTNKLSTNLRKDNSLCYTVSSKYDLLSNYLIVHSKINKNNKKIALRLINKSLKEIQRGKFSDEELNNAINYLENAITNSLNNQECLINNYIYHNLINAPLLNDRKEFLDKITKQDIINLSKRIKLLSTYFMEGIKNERN